MLEKTLLSLCQELWRLQWAKMENDFSPLEKNQCKVMPKFPFMYSTIFENPKPNSKILYF